MHINSVHPLAILAPNEWEIAPLWDAVQNAQKGIAGIVPYVCGEISGVSVIVALTYAGKIFAASSTQKVLDVFSPSTILLSGACGGLDPSLSRGTLVLADKIIEHDAGWWLTTGFRHVGTQCFDSQGSSRTSRAILPDSRLLAIARKVIPNACVGALVSGDQAIFNSERREQLRQSHGNALAVEMEAASVAAVSVSNQIPFLIIRAIGDLADAETGLDENWFADLEIYSDQHSMRPIPKGSTAQERSQNVREAWQRGADIAAEATIKVVKALAD